MLKKPTIAEVIIATRTAGSCVAGVCIISFNFNIPAPTIIGVESKNENLAALSLERPANSPVDIVIPARETPGIIAKA